MKANRKQHGGRPRAVRKRRVGRVLAWLLVLAAAAGAAWFGAQSVAPDLLARADRLFKITVIEVPQGQRVSRDQALALLDVASGQGLVSTDTRALERTLETHPWIRRATVRRVFPHTLGVEIEERIPVAVLRTGRREFLVDPEGVLIAEGTPGAHETLPVLTGVEYVDALSGATDTVERLRAGIALAGLLDQTGAGRMEVDLRTPGDLVAYYSGLRLRFGNGAFEEKVDRYRRVSDRMFDQWGAREPMPTGRGVEVDLRFRDRIIVRERG